KATFARLILDYNTLNSRLRSQALFGWTPSPGTAFYAGYNDDLNYDSRHPFTAQIVPGFRRNSRTFFIKMSSLIRKGFCFLKISGSCENAKDVPDPDTSNKSLPHAGRAFFNVVQE